MWDRTLGGFFFKYSAQAFTLNSFRMAVAPKQSGRLSIDAILSDVEEGSEKACLVHIKPNGEAF